VKKHCFVVLLSILSIGATNAQFVSQFSQYMFAKGSFNPAAIAEGDMMNVSGIHRQQWIGMPGAPVDTHFSLSMPFTIKKQNIGVGLAFDNEKLGLFSKQAITLQGAYKLKLWDGVLSLGANLGAISVGFEGDSVHIPSGSYGNDYHVAAGSDPQIPTSKVSGMSFDVSLGAYYTTPKWYLGLSLMDALQPTIKWNDTQETYVGSMLFFTGGYNISMSNPYFTLKPSLLLKTNFVNYQADLDLLLDYNNKFWGGLAYRFNESLIFMGGIHLINGFSIGYSFDLPMSSLIASSFGSHEIFVSYDFKISFDKRRNKYKSVRIL